MGYAMKCPECGELLEVHLNENRIEGAEYEELEFSCPNGHAYFVRIKEEDLIEVD